MPRIESTQEKAETTPDVEYAAFTPEAIKETGAIALVAANPVLIGRFDSAPIFFAIKRFESLRSKLWFSPD